MYAATDDDDDVGAAAAAAECVAPGMERAQTQRTTAKTAKHTH